MKAYTPRRRGAINLSPSRSKTSAVACCRVAATAVAGRTPARVLRLLRSEHILFFFYYHFCFR